MKISVGILALVALYSQTAAAAPIHTNGTSKGNGTSHSHGDNGTSTQCRKTSVAILGAGVAGIIAAQPLQNNSIHDFIIVGRDDYVGGRLRKTKFGKPPDGEPYTIELGTNWIQSLGEPGNPQNPIWLLAEKWGLKNHRSDYSSILTYDADAHTDLSDLLYEWESAYENITSEAFKTILMNFQDTAVRVALKHGGRKPYLDMQKQAVDWSKWDWENATPPETSSFANFVQWSDDNNLSIDPRGYHYWLAQEAGTFLHQDDSRLLLHSTVADVEYGEGAAAVTLDSGECIEAQYVLCTFALRVLQNDALNFVPSSLPEWKRTAIDEFQMNIYTRIFFQFNETFWDPNATIPDPIAFTYPRWDHTNWTYGSHSSWPNGLTLQEHQNLRANIGRSYFAGEAQSAEYFGFL